MMVFEYLMLYLAFACFTLAYAVGLKDSNVQTNDYQGVDYLLMLFIFFLFPLYWTILFFMNNVNNLVNDIDNHNKYQK